MQYKAALQRTHPLLHGNEAETTASRGLAAIEASAIVLHAEQDPAIDALEVHFDKLCSRVLDDVLETLLSDPVKTGLRHGLKRLGYVSRVKIDPEILVLRDVGAMLLESGHQAQMFQKGRVQVMTDAAHLIRHIDDFVLDRDDVFLLVFRQVFGHLLQSHRHRGNPRVHAIV